jgi:hypothetical protein
MRRNLAFGGSARPVGRTLSSIACLVFVVALAIAFWAGALWIGNFLMQVSSGGF